jgi:hypothetical protein
MTGQMPGILQLRAQISSRMVMRPALIVVDLAMLVLEWKTSSQSSGASTPQTTILGRNSGYKQSTAPVVAWRMCLALGPSLVILPFALQQSLPVE